MDNPPRREPRKFEPPPWERDAFEELRRRKEQERAERELQEALERARQAAAQPPAPPPQSAESEKPPPSQQEAAEAAGLDERAVERMLIQLSLEEPKATTHVATLANAVAAAMAAAGLGFVVWSAVLFARTRTAGDAVAVASPLVTTIASLLMMLWGFMMIGGGVLLWRRHNVR
ncbi:MAG: hypothetical protein N3B11_00500 [Coriobacteriia bacterium]|nr:hypothetical protein [Coriobacteriia bacterium]